MLHEIGKKQALESPDCNRELSIRFVVGVLFKFSKFSATNATSECSFSAFRRVKTYLRSTMTQNRLNNLMILHIYITQVDSLDIKAVVNEFVSAKKTRPNFFYFQ